MRVIPPRSSFSTCVRRLPQAMVGTCQRAVRARTVAPCTGRRPSTPPSCCCKSAGTAADSAHHLASTRASPPPCPPRRTEVREREGVGGWWRGESHLWATGRLCRVWVSFTGMFDQALSLQGFGDKGGIVETQAASVGRCALYADAPPP
jgi:hypothetical protein